MNFKGCYVGCQNCFSRRLPEPQPRNDKREHYENQETGQGGKNKIMLPTRIPPVYEESGDPVKNKALKDKKKMYLDIMREKMKSMYKQDKVTKPQSREDPFGIKIEDTPHDMNKEIMKRKLPIAKRLQAETRKVDSEVSEKNIIEELNKIDIIKGLEHLTNLTDQIALESSELSPDKPLNKVLAMKDDIIYKQMNYWRNQFESERLIDFLSPNKNESGKETKTEVIVGTPKSIKRRKIMKKSEKQTNNK